MAKRKKQPNKQIPLPTSQDSGALAVLRRLGGFAFVFVGWQLIPQSYTWGVIIVYFGFAFLLAECIWDRVIYSRPYQLQLAAIAAVFFFATLFTVTVVTVWLPLDIFVTGSNAQYPLGIVVGDIEWNPKFYPVTIDILNNSNYNYYDLDLVAMTDKPIAKITQISGSCHLSFENANPLLNPSLGFSHQGQLTALPIVEIASDDGYRIHCDRMLSHSRLEVVIAVASVNENKPKSLMQDIFTWSNGHKYWYTFKTNPDLVTGEVYSERSAAMFVQIDGTYKALNRTRTKSEHIPIKDTIDEMMQNIQKLQQR
ncbi:MAG TPA: hypothetical protein VMI32_15340 [Candidatus Solibacter sp.]|nr:hypothetical protein [Candidatus Solibacter sp.]